MRNIVSSAIFKKWKLDLAKRDRSMKNVELNFNDLISDLNLAGIEYEEAKDIMEEAIKCHYPSTIIIKNTYKIAKDFQQISLHEFAQNWREMISNKGWSAFHDIYPDPDLPQPNKLVNNGMSPQEYAAQERIANMFEPIDPQQAASQIQEYIRKLEQTAKEEFGIDLEKLNG